MVTWSRKRVAAAVGAALLVMFLLVAGLVAVTPDFYARTEGVGPDDPAKDLFNERVVNGVGNVLLDKSGRTPLDVTITEEMVNARLAAFLEETRARGPGAPRLPPALERLRVAFEPGRVILATRVGEGLASLVLSEHLHLEATADGRLRVETVGVRVGYLPLPSRLADRLTEVLRRHVQQAEAEGADAGALEVWHGVLRALEGEPVTLAGKKLGIALDAVETDRGALRVRGRRIER